MWRPSLWRPVTLCPTPFVHSLRVGGEVVPRAKGRPVTSCRSGHRDDEDTLDLDKAWSDLQRATAPAGDEPARPAFRMFEGQPTWTGQGHLPWTRVIPPGEVPAIAEDLMVLDDDEIPRRVVQQRPGYRPGDAEYAVSYLQSARSFMAALAQAGRGMVYRIG